MRNLPRLLSESDEIFSVLSTIPVLLEERIFCRTDGRPVALILQMTGRARIVNHQRFEYVRCFIVLKYKKHFSLWQGQEAGELRQHTKATQFTCYGYLY